MISHTLLKFLFISVAGIFLGGTTSAQVRPVLIEHVDSLMKQDPKPIVILLSTEWCKFCLMQRTQFQKSRKIKENSDKFYFVEFNAETAADVSFNHQIYRYRAKGNSRDTHELAIALTGSVHLSFPTVVFLDRDYSVLFRHQGVLTKTQLDELASMAVSKSRLCS